MMKPYANDHQKYKQPFRHGDITTPLKKLSLLLLSQVVITMTPHGKSGQTPPKAIYALNALKSRCLMPNPKKPMHWRFWL